MKKSKSNTKIHCRHCGNEYNQKHVENVFGKFSMPAALGYCSASCYTKSLTEAGTKINSIYAKGEWEKDGTLFSNQTQIKCNGKTIGNWEGHNYSSKINSANVDRIISCVNMHDDLVKENEELKEWKEQQIKLTAPILEFMGNNSDKFNLRVGDSIFKKVLGVLKQEEEK